MISALLLSLTVSFITMIFSFFPQVDVLPTILGVNLDTVIVGGIASLMRLADVFWYIGDVIQGFLYICGYLAVKATLKFLSGAFQNIGGAALN
jgi:hypothetical protein